LSKSQILLVDGLVKHLGNRRVLHDVHIEVNPHEVLALLGENGAGKSTTLRCIVGEMTKDQGSIAICGADLDLDPLTAKGQLGYAADEPFLYPYLTGREHVQLWRAFRKRQDVQLAYAWELAARLGLASVLDGQTRTYSRGMRQKLAFIGALFHQPGLIVLDEPFTAMDTISTETAIVLLQDACDRGSGIIFTSHQAAIVHGLQATIKNLEAGLVIGL
jgi:ABC-2 type transport system ATP-binding protein